MLIPTLVTPGKPLDYEAWKVSTSLDGNSAIARRKINGDVAEVALRRSSLSIPLEGWYRERPSGSVHAAVGGVCIMCECCLLDLHHPDGRTSRRPPFSVHGEEAIKKDMANGFHPVALHVPIELCLYHHRLVPSQASITALCKARKMMYHVPRKEYHVYANRLEAIIGALPGFHIILEEYVDLVDGFVRKTFSWVGVPVHIIDPFQPGMDPNDAYVLPYDKPEMFGLDPEHLMGAEDLIELRLAVEAEKRGRHAFPVWVGVLGLPESPYRQRGVAQTKRFSLDSLR